MCSFLAGVLHPGHETCVNLVWQSYATFNIVGTVRSPEFLDSVTERINIFTAQFKNEGSGEGEMATFRMPERSPQTTVWMSGQYNLLSLNRQLIHSAQIPRQSYLP